MSLSFLFVTGLSGAGKSQTLRVLEDLGYFCVDNLPIPLVSQFAALANRGPAKFDRVAIGVDIREGAFFQEFWQSFDRLKVEGHGVEVLFLDAGDDVLMRRFSETRRPHPLSLAAGLPLLEAIREERQRLAALRKRADRVVETSLLSVAELRILMGKSYGVPEPEGGMVVYLLSFGFKFGLPMDADMVFDVRFLPNPNYDPRLRPRTGKDMEVWSFLQERGAESFLGEFSGFLLSLLPRFAEERRSTLTIAVGCTGGRHRSVGIAEHLGIRLEKVGYRIRVAHRDIDKDSKRYRPDTKEVGQE